MEEIFNKFYVCGEVFYLEKRELVVKTKTKLFYIRLTTELKRVQLTVFNSNFMHVNRLIIIILGNFIFLSIKTRNFKQRNENFFSRTLKQFAIRKMQILDLPSTQHTLWRVLFHIPAVYLFSWKVYVPIQEFAFGFFNI